MTFEEWWDQQALAWRAGRWFTHDVRIWNAAQEAMRERAAKAAELHEGIDTGPSYCGCGDVVAEAIRALPIE